MNKEVEIWKDIPGYEGIYQCSNLGEIKSSLKIKKPRYRCGYLYIKLCKKSKVKQYKLHQVVAMTFLDHIPSGMSLVVDHINNNKLDNRAINLQIISQRENSSKDRFRSKKKTSKYVGVSWQSDRKKWTAQIHINGVTYNLGRFKNEIDAHEAYQNELSKLK